MNFFKTALLLLTLIAFSACGKDDDEPVVCVQSDWVGTYEGTVDCDGTVENTTVTITANGTDAIIIEYQTGSVTTTYNPLIPNGCNASNSGTLGGVTGSVDVSLDGDNLELTDIITGGGFDATCVVTATRK